MGSVSRRLFVLLAAGALAGCVATNYVLSIGGRSTLADKRGVGAEKEITLEMKDVPLEVQGGHGLSSVGPASEGKSLGNVLLKVDDIKWSEPEPGRSRKGEVILMVNGVLTQFEVSKWDSDYDIRAGKDSDRIMLEHTYRRWYGYPAQVLLVGAVPIDAVIFVVMIPVGIVYSIFSD